MKLSMTAIFVVACMLVLARGAQAQDTKEHNMAGCLRAGNGNTYLLSSRAMGPRLAVIVSSSADLASHVRERVEVTGKLVPAKEAEADPDVPKAFRYMNVTAIKTISATCQ